MKEDIKEAVKGCNVSIDVSYDDDSAGHRIFAKVIGVQEDNGEPTLLCELKERNYEPREMPPTKCCHWHDTYSKAADYTAEIGEVYHAAKLHAYQMCYNELRRQGFELGSCGDNDMGGVMAWLDYAIMECAAGFDHYEKQVKETPVLPMFREQKDEQ